MKEKLNTITNVHRYLIYTYYMTIENTHRVSNKAKQQIEHREVGYKILYQGQDRQVRKN